MTPLRVKLQGFLSYREPREVSFAGASVWLLAGANGSGKSSVFDAVTYALFGYHRGGSQNAVELVNKESRGFTVEFDFALDGKPYRIKRTLKKSAKGDAKTTQQVFAAAGDDFEAVPDTSKKADFDAWVSDRVGLTYETFTASVLLLQGKSEKLLDSKPSGRAEVLAGIVDLARYQKLHDAANQKRLVLKGQVESLGEQAKGVPQVADEEWAAATMNVASTEATRDTAATDVETARHTAAEAKRWAAAVARANAAADKLAGAERLLADAVKIESDFAKMTDLAAALPAVNTVVTTRGKMRESEARSARIEKEKADADRRRKLADHNAATALQQKATLAKALADDEAKYARGQNRLRELAAVLQSVKLAEEQQAAVAKCAAELTQFPGDPAADAATAAAEVERVTAAVGLLPTLERMATERQELVASRKLAAELLKDLEQIKADGKTASEAETAAKKAAEDAAKLLATATADAAKATAEKAAAAKAVEDVSTLTGSANCRACGQPLTAEHLEEETTRREAESRAASAAATATASLRDKAVAKEKAAVEALKAASDRVAELRTKYRLVQAEQAQAVAASDRHTKYLTETFTAHAAEFTPKFGPEPPTDWAATTYPSAQELDAIRALKQSLPALKKTAEAAKVTLSKWQKAKADADSATQTLSRLTTALPADPATVREEHATLAAAEKTLLNAIKATKAALEKADRDRDTHSRDAHAATTDITERTGKLHTEEETRTLLRDAIDRAMKGLPGAWQWKVETAGLTEYHVWKEEHDELTDAKIAAKFQQLAAARGTLDNLRLDSTAAREEADAFPPAVRLTSTDAEARVNAAKAALVAAELSARDARRTLDTLAGHRDRRRELGAQFLAADAEFHRYKVLAELLGRDRLQRHLVRTAERQIVDFANQALDRLSGGTLFLKVVGADGDLSADKALDLECVNRATGGPPIGVMYLSGSQKFRVAVSLALGIGRYASRRHRPIETVIIDEGFGSLDREGRQTMIQELQNLKGFLKCVLLVSHQEEFAEAFPDGYRFTVTDRTTGVERFGSGG